MLRRASASAPALALLLAALSAGGLACDDAGSNAAGGPDGSGAGSAPATADQPVAGDGLRIVSDDPAHEGRTPEELERQGVRLYFHDFGRVPLGEVVRHTFHLRNTDSAPIEVSRFQPSCSCTTGELVFEDASGETVRLKSSSRNLEQTPIPAGADVDLVIVLDTNHSEPLSHNTDKLYSVQMVNSSPNRGFQRFEAHIMIERAFQATPQPLDLQRIPKSAGGVGTLDVVPVGDSGATLVGVGPLPPGVNASLIAQPVYGREAWKLEVRLLPPLDPGPIRHTFDLMAVDAEGLPYPPFPIEVHAYGTEDVDWTPQRFLMRGAAGAAPDTAATVELYSLLAGERLLVTDARLVGEGTERLTLKVEPNLRDSNGRSERWTLRVGPKQPFGEGIVRGKVVVELEGRDPVEIELAINAN